MDLNRAKCIQKWLVDSRLINVEEYPNIKLLIVPKGVYFTDFINNYAKGGWDENIIDFSTADDFEIAVQDTNVEFPIDIKLYKLLSWINDNKIHLREDFLQIIKLDAER